MKGPSLQHDLKVLRVWTCPACGRKVRAEGTVTARVCECTDQAQMKYADAPPLPVPDVSAFVTYMTPEMQEDDDDGTDLPLPDLDTLVLPPEETSSRQKKTRPLRETVVESSEGGAMEEEAAQLDVQGELSTGEKTAEPGVGQSESGQAEHEESGRRKPRRRRRRGRRRGRGGDSQTAATDLPGEAGASSGEGNATQISAPAADQQQTDDGNATASPDDSSGSDARSSSGDGAQGGESKSGARRRRRRRRRRGSRGKSDGQSGEGGSGPGGNSSDGAGS